MDAVYHKITNMAIFNCRGNKMKKIILAIACLAFIAASPLVAAEIGKKPVSKAEQVQANHSKIESKGMTKAPNRVGTRDKVSSTGHKHDDQRSEDLRPNPLNAETAQSVNDGLQIPVNKPVQR